MVANGPGPRQSTYKRLIKKMLLLLEEIRPPACRRDAVVRVWPPALQTTDRVRPRLKTTINRRWDTDTEPHEHQALFACYEHGVIIHVRINQSRLPEHIEEVHQNDRGGGASVQGEGEQVSSRRRPAKAARAAVLQEDPLPARYRTMSRTGHRLSGNAHQRGCRHGQKVGIHRGDPAG